jgi:hypothetical protein
MKNLNINALDQVYCSTMNMTTRVDIKTKTHGGVLTQVKQLGDKGTPERKRYDSYPGRKDEFRGGVSKYL